MAGTIEFIDDELGWRTRVVDREHTTTINNLEAGAMLWGRSLRFVLVGQLQRYGSLTVAEMVAILDSYGFVLGGRASKVISDSLRWEVARGRVTRVSRGVYVYRRAPASTARRIRLFARTCLDWMAAVGRRELPAPTPSTPHHRKAIPTFPEEDRYRPPWQSTSWLWSC